MWTLKNKTNEKLQVDILDSNNRWLSLGTSWHTSWNLLEAIEAVFLLVFERYKSLCIELSLLLQDIHHSWDFCQAHPLKHWISMAPASPNYIDNQKHQCFHLNTPRNPVENHLSRGKELDEKKKIDFHFN